MGNGWGLGSQQHLVTNGPNYRPLEMRARAMEVRREVDQQDLVTDDMERIKEREESQITPGVLSLGD